MRIPMITAHSGCEGTEQDSVESILRGMELGADAVEMDVRLDDGGILRISHNKEKSEEAYKNHVALRQIFEFIRDSEIKINLDVKESNCIPSILRLAEREGLHRDRLILSGAVGIDLLFQNPTWGDRGQIFLNLEEIFKYAMFQYVSSPEDFRIIMERPWAFIKTHLTAPEDYIPWILHVYKDLPVAGVNIPQWILNSKMLESFEKEKVAVSVWTVDDMQAQKRFLSSSVRCIVNLTTRNVASAIRIRDAVKEY